jgi:hypothetical protein
MARKAGVAITTSPTQVGMMTTMRSGSSVVARRKNFTP